tara:strand:+ start:12016 stop:12579 length:564 start_codon:yes stop_codon:yes gene_type:complete
MKIGITGSISAGKSTVLKILKKRKFSVFSADEEVKNLYKNRSFVNFISKKLKLRRKKNLKKQIKTLINTRKLKLKTLEGFIHPLVRKKMIKFVKNNKKKKIIFLEIPLLSERNLFNFFDKNIYIGASKKIRLKRFLKTKKSKKLFHILEKRQHNPRVKMKKCDYVINNNQSIQLLQNKIKYIISKYE